MLIRCWRLRVHMGITCVGEEGDWPFDPTCLWLLGSPVISISTDYACEQNLALDV